MPQETDTKLYDDLRDNGYKQSTEDPNRCYKSNGRGGYDEVDTDGRWYKGTNATQWEKHQ